MSASSMTENRFCDSEEKVTALGASNGTRFAQEGDLLLLVRGSGLHKRLPVGKVLKPLTFNQDVKALTPDTDQITTDYLLYWFLANEYNILGKVELTGIGAGKLDTLNMQNMVLRLPPLPTQRQIAAILSAFDDKIELNRQMNRTLEQMARALFKSWFVDFDPVRAKMRGEMPEGIDAETAALFPDDMEEVEGREVPQGWSRTHLGAIADIIDCLHSKKPERVKEGLPYIQLGNIGESGKMDLSDIYYISEEDYKRWTSRIEVVEGDCVITNVGRVGAVCRIPRGFRGAIGRNMTAIRLKKDFSTYRAFLIELLVSDEMRSEIDANTDAGTILSALNVKSIPKLGLILPTERVLCKAEKYLASIRSQIDQNLRESTQLAQLRDSLLPRLLSGELDVSQWVEVAEEVLA